MFSYDLKAAGESSSHPATRMPSLCGNGEHLKGMLRMALDTSGVEGGGLGDRGLVLLFDGGRAGLRARATPGRP